MHRLVVSLALVAACSGLDKRSPPLPERHPKLVVLVVIDQLSTWAFDRDRPLFTGGFARLVRDGGFVRAGDLPYANPFTAPGHASIATGAPPSVHGVLGNAWYRRGEGRERDAEYDTVAPTLQVGPSQGGELAADDTGSSQVLLVDGIADTVRRAHPNARTIAIGLKARAACFVAGRRPELAVWYEAAAGGMTTSRAYAAEPPDWLVRLARDKPASRFFKERWTPLDEKSLAAWTKIADDAPGEGAAFGLRTVFPHDLAAVDSPGEAIVFTPFADELVLDTALAAIDAMQLGADDVPDLLALSFNAHDYAGHLWGPGSWEVVDLTLRLDALLGRLFETLDARLGRDGWSVVLTSDHGITPVVDQSNRGRRITTAEIRAAIDAELARLGTGARVSAVTSNNIYLTGANEAALDAAAAVVAKLPNIAAAGRINRIAGKCATRNELDRAICSAVVDGQSGELYVLPAAGSLITDYKTGTHHDAPFDDNRHVPILVMAPGLQPQTGTGTILQVAPTLAALLGVPRPPAATADPLFGLGSRQ